MRFMEGLGAHRWDPPHDERRRDPRTKSANVCLPRTEAGEANSPRQGRPRCGGKSRRFYRWRRATPGKRRRRRRARAAPPVTPRPCTAPVRIGRERRGRLPIRRRRRGRRGRSTPPRMEKTTTVPPAVATTPAKKTQLRNDPGGEAAFNNTRTCF